MAVFMGFLSENLREKHSEKLRENQYIENLLRDLNSDTIALSNCIQLNRQKIFYIDSLIKLRYLDFSIENNLKIFLNLFTLASLVRRGHKITKNQ